MKGHRQTTDGVGYETEYAYNLSGAMVEQRYPSGRVVKNVLDASGDLSMVQSARCMDAAASTDADCTAQAGLWNYAKNFTYNAAGAVTSMQLGNGRWESTAFNSRVQPTQIALGATPNATNLLKLDYSYGTTANNGNVLSQTITVPSVTIGGTTHNGFTAVQNYAYDSLNRLDDAAEYIDGNPTPSWRQDFTFDRYGNRRFVEGNTTFEGFEKLCESGTELCAELRKIMNPSANASDNRLGSSDGYVFDPAGNTVRDPQGRRFTYDGENKQVMVETLDANGNPVTTVGEYEYDGDGKRVKKHVPATGEVTVFVYDAGGKLIGEYSTVAAPQSPKVSYTTADHLGSPRILTDENGATISRRDFMPYGEEIARTAYSSDNVRQKFTTYERDGETNLDFAQARMHNFNLGRFTSPDDFLNDTWVVEPSSWNLYSYAKNSPLNFIDPSGTTVENTDVEGRQLSEEQMRAIERDLRRKTGLSSIAFQNGRLTYDANEVAKGGSRKMRDAIVGAINDTKNTFRLGTPANPAAVHFQQTDSGRTVQDGDGRVVQTIFEVQIDFADYEDASRYSDSDALDAFSVGLNLYHEFDHKVGYDPSDPIIGPRGTTRGDMPISTRSIDMNIVGMPSVIQNERTVQYELGLPMRDLNHASNPGPNGTQQISFTDRSGRQKFVRWRMEANR